MTDISCDICGRPCSEFLVCSVPGFPVSLNHCEYCLAIGAMPLFTAEVTLEDDRLDRIFKRPTNLYDTVKYHGVATVKSNAAEWFLDSPFWIPPEVGIGPGRYMSLRSYLDYLTDRL